MLFNGVISSKVYASCDLHQKENEEGCSAPASNRHRDAALHRYRGVHALAPAAGRALCQRAQKVPAPAAHGISAGERLRSRYPGRCFLLVFRASPPPASPRPPPPTPTLPPPL